MKIDSISINGKTTEFEISEKISCTNNFNILYDSEPPPGISKYIYRFENGFIYSF